MSFFQMLARELGIAAAPIVLLICAVLFVGAIMVFGVVSNLIVGPPRSRPYTRE